MIFKKKKKDVPDTEPPEKTEGSPEKPMLIIDSVVKETNGYIEISITCKPVSGINRQTLIKKDQILRVDMFYQLYTPTEFHHFVWLDINGSKTYQPMLIIDSVVKETNGYIEISITCKPVSGINRQTLIKKDQILRVDMFYQLYTPTEFHHFVWLDINGSKTDFCFECKEDAENLYNALAKILKKKDVKPAVSKKAV